MVSHVYDRVAERYDDDWSDIYATSRAQCMRQITQHFGDTSAPIDALDLAVGTGNAFNDLHQHFKFGNCTGLDISPGMLQQAERKLGNRVDLKLQDARYVKNVLPANSYDLAMSHFLLNFLQADRLLESAFHVLKPGGVLSLATSTKQSLKELHTGRFALPGKLLGVQRSLDKMSTPGSHPEMLQKLEEHGFVVVQQRHQVFEVSFTCFDDARAWAVDSGWMVSSMDKFLGLRIAGGRLIIATLERLMDPLYPVNASCDLSIVLAMKPA